jgi:putative intracellular protease/amidase
MFYRIVCLVLISLLCTQHLSIAQAAAKKGRILYVVTSHDRLGDSGKKTGYFLSEVTHPYKVLVDAGYQVDFVSPLGGTPPVDPISYDLKDPINKWFLSDSKYSEKLQHSMQPADVDYRKYQAIIYAGGHGGMWDFPKNKTISRVAAKIYENGGVVAAVCHGPSGLLNIKLSNGKYLISGKRIAGFSNEEEKKVKLSKTVPFLLESKLKERGGRYSKSKKFTEHVVVSGRLITGQNPESATKLGQEIVRVLDKLK